jgi:hypothetical protein
LNAGAATVELALVELPSKLEDLTRADFTCHSFAFGGDAFDQDIICQLLAKNETWGMSIDLPRPGHPDLPSRYQLQQRLQGSAFGLQLLERQAHKSYFATSKSFAFDIAQQHWDVSAKIGKSGFSAFVQQLNRELNALLSRAGCRRRGLIRRFVQGVWVLGRRSPRWLRTEAAECYSHSRPEFEVDRDIFDIHNSALNAVSQSTNFSGKKWFSCRRVGEFASLSSNFGCVAAAVQRLFSAVGINAGFGCPNSELSGNFAVVGGQGVNTRTCESRILRILEGKLPGGVVPAEEDFMLLGEESRQNPDWKQFWPSRFSLKMSHGVIA